MKIIVCGAGSVGKSIVSYLVKGNNDVIVIDNNQKRLDEMAQEFDVLPILGSASHPSVLEKADAGKAKLLIAATDDDEVNLVTCSVAQALFSVPRKIARINSREFQNPLWSTLYSDKNIPVDLVISPDEEIGKYIYNMLKIPGTSEARPLVGGKMHLIAFKIPENSPFVKVPLLNLKQIDDDIDIEIVCINRKGNIFIPYKNDSLEAGDEIYVLTATDKIGITMAAFGAEHSAIERLIVFGGNAVSRCIGRLIEKDDNIISCKIIEEDFEKADETARELNDTIVMQGPMMSDKILSEAGIYGVDAAVAVTSEDEDNLLAAMLSKKCGVKNTLALLNSPAYNSLVDIVGSNILVDRSSVTISHILHELRKTEVRSAYSLGRGFAEIWEIPLLEDTKIVGQSIKSLDLPASSKICAIVRGEETIYPSEAEILNAGDILIMYVDSASIRKVEKILD